MYMHSKVCISSRMGKNYLYLMSSYQHMLLATANLKLVMVTLRLILITEMECFDEYTLYTEQKPAKWYHAKVFIITNVYWKQE